MLEPLDRRHLLESLHPPAGYKLDDAIGTTYSLDLMTLLTVPLAFALMDVEGDDGQLLQDPLALLEAIRSYANRTHIFCQAGGIYLPSGNTLFLSHLEDTVHEVVAPKKGGIFHPKIWVLRFEPTYENQPVIYRVLVLSRNLTFDRSWDTMLLLEGKLKERERVIRQSNPLGAFVASLPQMMLHSSSRRLQRVVKKVSREIRRVRFELPDEFEEMHFHPIGLPDSENWWFDGRLQQMLAVAPFIDPHTASELGDVEGKAILVSRLEQLQQLPSASLQRFEKVYFLPPDAEPEPEDEGEDNPPAYETLSGLHAKLFVADDGWNARIWTGSSNATTAAMRKNVEFLVELKGKKSQCGVDAFLSQRKGETGFIDLLRVYEPTDDQANVDETKVALDRCKHQLRMALASSGVDVLVTPCDIPERYNVEVNLPKSPRVQGVKEVELKVWPVTLKENAAKSAECGPHSKVTFTDASFESLTAFYAIKLRARFNGKEISDRFVLCASVKGMPGDRGERVLRALLKNRDQVMRFLLFLLAEDGVMGNYLTKRSGNECSGQCIDFLAGTSLFEPLVNALYSDPDKIDRVARLVEDLIGSEDGRKLLPEEFMAIWEPVWAARKEIRK